MSSTDKVFSKVIPGKKQKVFFKVFMKKQVCQASPVKNDHF
jgi:hypothetical protein